jgi:Tol biopolymer transport system component
MVGSRQFRWLSRERRAVSASIAILSLVGCAGTPAATPSTGTSQPPASASAPPSPSVRPSAPPKPSAVAVGAGEPWIAYQGGSGGPPKIRFVRPDGTGDHALAAAGVPSAREKPDWSPDGSRVALRAEDEDGTLDIWVMNADGSEPERVVDCAAPCAWTDDPAWSPDGSSIAYQQGTAVGSEGLGVGTIEVVDLATGKARTVFTGADTEYCYSPRWSPDGRSIVVELDRFDSARLDASVVTESTIGIVTLGSAKPSFRPLLPWGGGPSSPDWSSTGDLIVFAKPLGAKAGGKDEELFVIAADASGLRQVGTFSASGGRALQPSWTPDGDRIIFVLEDVAGSRSNVAFVTPDGSGLERLPAATYLRTHPRLRPGP